MPAAKNTKKRSKPKAGPSASKIEPGRVYSLREFMAITGISRQSLSRIRQTEDRPDGLVVRDAGMPTIRGDDYLKFVENAPAYKPKLRGRHKPQAAS